MPWRILIPDRLRPPADIEQSVLGRDTIFFTPATHDAEAVPGEYWAQADAILAWHEVQLHAGVIAKLDRCKVIVRVGAGFDNVDLRAAGDRGIAVCNVPDYGTEDVADHTLGFILALERGLLAYDAAARQGRWSWEAVGNLRRIRGCRLGIIGLGRIGTATAIRALAFGVDVSFYDPYKPPGYDKALGLRQVRELPELLSEADVVTLHTPLTDETRNMADKVFFAQLKPGGLFINTARGGCHDMDALYETLESGHLRAAGLDVLPQEPPNPEHPLIKAWKDQQSWLAGRLLITPHAAFYNQDSYQELRRKAAEEARRVLCGQPPLNCLNARWMK